MTAERIDIDEKYHWTWNYAGRPVLTCQRYDETPREIWEKSTLSLFFYAKGLEDKVRDLESQITGLENQLADSYKSDDLPDLVGSGDTVGISLEDTDIV